MKIHYGKNHRRAYVFIILFLIFFIVVLAVTYLIAKFVQVVMTPHVNELEIQMQTNDITCPTCPNGQIQPEDPAPQPSALSPQPFQFTLQYGLDILTNFGVTPWITTGTNLISSSIVQTNAITDSNGNYWMADSFMYEGDVWVFDTNGNCIWQTNWSSGNPSAVIMRSTDLIHWQDCYTDSVCGVGTVSTWADSEYFSNAYYRLRTQ